MIKTIFLITLTAVLSVAFQPAAAQEADLTTRELVDQRLLDLRDQLSLSDYQWSQVEMILKSSIRERVAITRRYGLDQGPEALEALEGSERRAMKRELKDCRKDTEKRMKRYLDKEQYKEFKAVQEEIHDDLLARLDQA